MGGEGSDGLGATRRDWNHPNYGRGESMSIVMRTLEKIVAEKDNVFIVHRKQLLPLESDKVPEKTRAQFVKNEIERALESTPEATGGGA